MPLSPRDLARISKVVKTVERQPRNQAGPRSRTVSGTVPEVQIVRVTSATPTSGRYPGKVLLHDVAADTYSDLGDIWVVDPNGASLGVKKYPARRSGEVSGVPVFITDGTVGAAGTITVRQSGGTPSYSSISTVDITAATITEPVAGRVLVTLNDASNTAAGIVSLGTQKLGTGLKSVEKLGVTGFGNTDVQVQLTANDYADAILQILDSGGGVDASMRLYNSGGGAYYHELEFAVDETNQPFQIRIRDYASATNYYGQTDTDPIGNVFHGGICVEVGTGTAFTSAGTGLEDEGGGALGLADTAVTPGSYTYSSITVDQQGRLTAASSATVTAARVLGSVAGGAVDELTLTNVLDLVGSAAQGDILYRNASAWVRLGAGTSGHFLKTQGAAANPTWAAAPGVTDHGALTGLSDDDHSQYVAGAGRASPQTIYGGTGSAGTLTLHGTSHATKGSIIFGSSIVGQLTTLTSDTTLDASHTTALIDSSSGAVIATLPAASGASGRIYLLHCIDRTNSVTAVVSGGGNFLLRGATTTTLTFYAAGDYVAVQSDGTNWVVIDERFRPHQGRLRRTSTQTLSSLSTFTKAQLDTSADVIGVTADTVTNYRITINRAGLYTVSAGALIYGATASTGVGFGTIYRNGTAILPLDGGEISAEASVGIGVAVTLILQAGQYLELYVYQSSTTSAVIGGTTYLEAHLSVGEHR